MELYLKITAGFLLLVQAFHVAGSNLVLSTDSPGRTINKTWLRELGVGRQKVAAEQNTGEEGETDGMESSDDNMFTTGYTTMSVASGEDGEMANDDRDATTTSSGVTMVNATTIAVFVSDTTTQPEEPETKIPQTSPATSPTVSSRVNVTGAKEELENMTTTTTTTVGKMSTTHPATQNTTAIPDLSNGTETTLTPESNDTQDSTPETDTETWPTNDTETTGNVTTTEAPEINEASTTPLSTADFPSETTQTIPVTSTTMAASTHEEVNVTDKGAASGSSSERGLGSDIKHNKKNEAWGAILGTAVAVAFVGLVVYIILKKKHQKDFSHRKLVEEFPSDPVLRLDNSEPLDLNYGGRAYHNPGLQMDNIQMSNFPRSNN